MNTDGKFEEYKLAVNQQSTAENVALVEAAARGDLSRVRSLLAQGAKPNFFYRPEDQKNALHVAAEQGHAQVVELLLAHGAVVNAVAATDQSTPLVLASLKERNLPVVQALLEARADTRMKNGYGNTALHEACRFGNARIAQALLEARADPNTANHKGSTPLHTLCYGEDAAAHSVALLQLLVDSGAQVDARDKRGLSPLLVCCGSGR